MWIIYMGSYEVDENGQLILKNMLPGRYSLFEVQAPEGYEKLASAIQFEITENGGIVLGESAEIEELVYIEENVLFIKNSKEPEPTATPTPEPTATPTPEPTATPTPEPTATPTPEPTATPTPEPTATPTPEPTATPTPEPTATPMLESTATPTPEPTATPTPYIDTEIINNLPKTGDNTNIGVYVCFLVASIFGLVVCKKRKM